MTVHARTSARPGVLCSMLASLQATLQTSRRPCCAQRTCVDTQHLRRHAAALATAAVWQVEPVHFGSLAKQADTVMHREWTM